MGQFMIRNVISVLITLWFAVTVTFFMLRVLPGDAISAQLIQAGATEAEIIGQRDALGLNQPIIQQYVDYMIRLIQGDMGDSLTVGLPVRLMIQQQISPTIFLACTTMIVAIIWGVLLGIGAVSEATFIRRVCQLIVNLAISTPIYWTGTLLIIIFAVELRWFPITGNGNAKSLILPVSLLSFHVSGAIARIVQINLNEIKRASYILVAHAKGLTAQYILYRHIFRVALLPIISVIALQYGFLLSGTVITETLFSRPGLGSLLLSATQNQDYPLVQGLVVLTATLYIITNLIAEFLQKIADPRL
ncbi:MAG: ABC transporter permease [Aggregatilineales bacterium]